MPAIYYPLPLLHGIIQQPLVLEIILAKDKKTDPSKTTVATAVVTAQSAPRIKITGNGPQRAAKVSSVLAAGADVSQLDVDKTTTMPENFTLTPEPTGTLSQEAVDKILSDPANNHATDPIPPGTEGAFDPLAPEPFVPAPLASVPEGQTPILDHKPYANHNWGAGFSETLISRANELANKIWPTGTAYMEARHGMVRMPFGERNEVMEANRAYFDRYPLINELNRILGTDSGNNGRPSTDPGYPYAFRQRAEEVITKLRRLEKKEGFDVFDDATRERIIETVLVPTTSFGVNSQYHGYNFLDLRFPHQKAVVNEVLSKEEVGIIEMLINYIPRLRVLLANYDQHVGAYSEEDLLKPLTGNREERRHWDLQEDRKVLNTVKKVLNFFDQSIPSQVAQDFLPELRYPRKSADRYVELQRASKHLREASLDYIQETAPLSKMLDKILELSEALLAYFAAMVEEIAAVFSYLDRVGIPYTQLVDESKARIRESEFPW